MPETPTVIIPAAGAGRKTRSYGPKSLLQFPNGQVLVRRQVSVVREAYPKAEIIVVVGYEAERVLKQIPPSVMVVENEQYDATGVARSLAIALRVTSASRVIVAYGDAAFNRSALTCLPSNKSAVLVRTPPPKPKDGEVVLKLDEPSTAGVGVTLEGKTAVHFDYGLPTKWLGIVHLTGPELRLFRAASAKREARTHLGFELLNEVIDRGGSFVAVESKVAKVVTIETMADLARA